MKQKKKLSTSSIIALGYLVIILIGTLLLMLPFATRQNEYQEPFKRIFTSLFTATSATCVTGLTMVNTGAYWSLFGQIIILILIQIGGLGFMVVIYLIAVAFKKKITLHERKSLMQVAGSTKISGAISLLKRILIFTFCFEIVGTILIALRFIPEFGFWKGLYYSLFTSVSAFCNAGFDPLGQANSLVNYQTDVLLNIVIAILVISGGLGFIVWSDVVQKRFKWKKFLLHTRIVLITTASLLTLSTVLFFIFEYDGAAYDGLNLGQKIMASFFQATTCRTAGFAMSNQKILSDPSIALSTCLMFIGGSSGSTAGGIKTTTFAVLLLSILSTTRKKENIVVANKQLDANLTKNASAVFTFYLFLVVVSTLIILGIEETNYAVGFRDVMFEIASAVGTTGLSSASTTVFSLSSQIILILLMYAGRIGALVIIAIFRERKENQDSLQRPVEKIIVG